MEAVKAMADPLSSFVSVLLDTCAYAGETLSHVLLCFLLTLILFLLLLFLLLLLLFHLFLGTGNVLKIQALLHICSEYFGGDGEEGGGGGGGGKDGGKDGEKSSEKQSPEAASSEKKPADGAGGGGGADSSTDAGEDNMASSPPPPHPLPPYPAKGKAKSSQGKDKKSSSSLPDSKPDPGSLAEPGAHQAVAVLGIALIAMGEEIGSEMSLRTFNHLVIMLSRS